MSDDNWDDDDGMVDDWGDDDGDDDWGDDDPHDGMNIDGGEELPIELQIENAYYEAEDIRLENPKLALEQFQKVVLLGKECSTLGDEALTSVFKALCNIVSIYVGEHDIDNVTESYGALLEFVPKVTRNEGQEAVSTVLLEVSEWEDFTEVTKLYELTFKVLKSTTDQDRLLFRMRMKFAELCYGRQRIADAVQHLDTLLKSCQNDDGSDDMTKGSELLEIYAMQTQISMSSHDNVALKNLFEKTKDLTAAVKDPKSQSIIRECWGKMFGDQGQWSRAYLEFYDAFNAYSEIGNRKSAKQCLKYVVVANMLCGGAHNPFDAREAKVYLSDSDINAVEALRIAHESMEVARFNTALKELSRDRDEFLLRHLSGIIRDFQGKAIETIIKPYSRLRISFLAKELKISERETEDLLVELILDGRVHGRIDQVNGLLDMQQSGSGGSAKYRALTRWSKSLEHVQKTTVLTAGVLTSSLITNGGRQAMEKFGGADNFADFM